MSCRCNLLRITRFVKTTSIAQTWGEFMMNENEVLQALPAYALNALEPDEMVAVRAFLQTRPDLQQRVEMLTDAATQLTYAAPPTPLPTHLKKRVMELAHADVALAQQPVTESGAPQAEAPQDAATESTDETVAADERAEDTTPQASDAPFQRPASQPGAAGATRPRFIGAPTPTAPPRPRTPATPSRATEPRRNWFANALGWKVATLAALAAAVALAIINAQMLRETSNFTNQVATLQQNADDLQTQVTALESDKSDLEAALAAASTAAEGSNDEVANQLAALQEEVAKLQAENQQIRADYNEILLQQASTEQQLVEFAQAQTLVPIFGTEDTPDALGGLFSGPEGNLVALRGLDTLPAEQTYELWLIDAEGTPVPAGLLGADAPAQTAIRVELPGSVEEYSAVAVSIEPAAGSEQPTGPIVMVGTRT